MTSFGKQKGGAHHGIHDSNLQPVTRVDAHIKVEIEPKHLPPLCLLDEEPDTDGLYHCIRVRRVAQAPAPAPAPAEVEDEKTDVLKSPVVKNEGDDTTADACTHTSTCNIKADADRGGSQEDSLGIEGDPSLAGSTTEIEQSSIKQEINDDSAYSSNAQDNGVTQENVQTSALAISSAQILLDLAEGDSLPILSGVSHDESQDGDLPADNLESMEDGDANSGRDIDQDLNQVVDEDILPSHTVSGRGVRYVATDSALGCVWRDSTPDYGQEYEEQEEEEEEKEAEEEKEEEEEKEVSPPSSPDEQWNDAEFSLSSGGSNCSVDNDYHMRDISSSDEPDEDNEEPVLPTNPELPNVDCLVLPSPVLGLEHYRDILALTVAGAQDPFPSRPCLKETVDIYKNHKYRALDAGLGPGINRLQPPSDERFAAINPSRAVPSISGPSSSRSGALLAETSDVSPNPEVPLTLRRRRSTRYLEIPSHNRITRSMVKGQVLFKQLPGYGTSIKNFLSKVETVRGRPSRPSLAETPDKESSPDEGPPLDEESTSPPAARTRKSSVGAGNQSPRRRRKTISRSEREKTIRPKGKGPAVVPVVTPLVNKFLHLGGSRHPRSNGGPSTGPIGDSTAPRNPSPLGNSVITSDGYSHVGHLRSPELVMGGLEMTVPESSESVKRARRAASAPATSNTFNFGDLTISGNPQGTRTPLLPSRLGGSTSCRVHSPLTTRPIHSLRTHGMTGIHHRILRYPASTMASQQNRSDLASIAPGGEIAVPTVAHDWIVANANRWISLANVTARAGSNLVALDRVSETVPTSTPSNSVPSSQHPGGTTGQTRTQDGGRYIQMPDSSWVNVEDMAAAARYTCGSDGKWSKIE